MPARPRGITDTEMRLRLRDFLLQSGATPVQARKLVKIVFAEVERGERAGDVLKTMGIDVRFVAVPASPPREVPTTRQLLVPQYRQGATDYACGPVCIRMALDCLLIGAGRPKLDSAKVKQIEQWTMGGKLRSPNGTTYESMERAIRRSGFGCRQISGRTDPARMRHIRKALDAGHPVILGCRADLGGKRYRHYIVARGIDPQHLHIRDPFPKGRPTRISWAEFQQNRQPTSWGTARWGLEVYAKNGRVA